MSVSFPLSSLPILARRVSPLKPPVEDLHVRHKRFSLLITLVACKSFFHRRPSPLILLLENRFSDTFNHPKSFFNMSYSIEFI